MRYVILITLSMMILTACKTAELQIQQQVINECDLFIRINTPAVVKQWLKDNATDADVRKFIKDVANHNRVHDEVCHGKVQ